MLFNQAIDAMSMRHWDPSLNGHDHFFATFGKFGPTSSGRTGDMLAEVAARAAAEHVSYLELMVNTDGGIGAPAASPPDGIRIFRSCGTSCSRPGSATRSVSAAKTRSHRGCEARDARDC